MTPNLSVRKFPMADRPAKLAQLVFEYAATIRIK